MVKGLDSFRRWFSGFEDCYAIIGGTACDLLMEDAEREFRATKDIDFVLIIEAISAEFCKRFWEYIDMAGYEHRNKSTGNPQFYRFSRLKSPEYPAMIELFSRKADAITLPEGAALTPVTTEESIASLSAILLDDIYYNFLVDGRTAVSEVIVLGVPYIIPFKIKAWMDLTDKKAKGESIDSKDIRKHKNDVFRLTELLSSSTRVSAPAEIISDIRYFIEHVDFGNTDCKQLGLRMTGIDVSDRLKRTYCITESEE